MRNNLEVNYYKLIINNYKYFHIISVPSTILIYNDINT